jgi:hypothetical protein
MRNEGTKERKRDGQRKVSIKEVRKEGRKERRKEGTNEEKYD